MKFIKFCFTLLIILLLVCFCIVFYAFKIEPYRLTFKEHTLDSQNLDESFTLIHLSDFELSSNYTEKQLLEIVASVNQAKPDIIVFTGDLFENYAKYKPVKSVVSALSSLEATYGKYAVWGNNDYGGGAVRVYEDIMAQSGFHLLKNEGVNITLSTGEVIFLGGLDDDLLGKPNPEKTMTSRSDEAKYSILLAHEPDIAVDIPDYSLNLILSGHTHGGQVNSKYAQKKFGISGTYIRGMFELEHLGGTILSISNGFGTSRIPVRLFVPPQIVFFQIGK